MKYQNSQINNTSTRLPSPAGASLLLGVSIAVLMLTQTALSQEKKSATVEEQIVSLTATGVSPFASRACEKDSANCMSSSIESVDTDWTYLHAQVVGLDGVVRYLVGSDDLRALVKNKPMDEPLLVIDTFADQATVPAGYELISVRESQIMIAAREDEPMPDWNSTETLRALVAGSLPQVDLVHNNLAVHERAAAYALSEVTGESVDSISASIDDFSTGAAGYNAMVSVVGEGKGDIAFAVRPSQLLHDSGSPSALSTAALEDDGVPLLIRTAVFGSTEDWPKAISALQELAEASDNIR